MQYDLTERTVAKYLAYLRERERSEATIEKYLRSVRAFMQFLRERPVSRVNLVDSFTEPSGRAMTRGA